MTHHIKRFDTHSSTSADTSANTSANTSAGENFTFGIEEEYLLVDLKTRDLIAEQPPGFLAECEAVLGKQVSPEFLKCQIEIGTTVCKSPNEALRQLKHMRRTISNIAAQFGIAPIAAGTHPFAPWNTQEPTDRDRYHAIAKDLAGVGRRMVICGMHVHCGLVGNELRIDMMNQVQYFLPHLLMLSASSPFHEGNDTGLKCYRMTAYREVPRTGLPGRFQSWDEYRQTIDVLIKADIIQDATKIWWDIRPSDRYPTLEMRITDVCTRAEDAVAIAALYVSILALLARNRRNNLAWREHPLFLLNENRWRAMRYGVKGTLFDFGRGELVPFRYLLEELLSLVEDDAKELGLQDWIEHARRIAVDGTSADRQSAAYAQALANGATQHEALCAIVDHLVAETKGDDDAFVLDATRVLSNPIVSGLHANGGLPTTSQRSRPG
jgi:glutamate---cysteine ligase / carboxylate-amine ligase